MSLLVQKAGFTGYLMRVLEEGFVAAGQRLVLVTRQAHGISVAEANRIVNVERRDLDGARRLLGVPDLAAHFFVFYFGIVADLTPPVALAAYAGAAIAQANPMKTAFTATKLAIGAFIVPYVFALNPAMLFIDTTAWEVVLICITSCVGIFGVSAALEGYFLKTMAWYERLLSAAGGLLLIYPGLVTDVVGLALVATVLTIQLLKGKNTKTALPA